MVKHSILLRAVAPLILCLALAHPVMAEEVVGDVTAVEAGDSLRINDRGAQIEVDLAGIACPKPGQPYGDEACRFTSQATLGKRVRVEILQRPK